MVTDKAETAATAPAVPAPEIVAAPVPPAEASVGSLQLQQDCANVYRYLAPRGHTLDDVKRVDYWRNNAADLKVQRYAGTRPWHRIEVIADDGSWEAELRVLHVDTTGNVETRVLRAWHGDIKQLRAAEPPKGYRIEHVTARGWRVIDPRGAIIVAEKVTESEALGIAIDHARRMPAAA